MRAYVPPQDAGRSRTQTAGAEFPPFSTRDLDGTRADRLHSIATTMDFLALTWAGKGESVFAEQCARNARHYHTLAAIHRGENPPLDLMDFNVRNGSAVKGRG